VVTIATDEGIDGHVFVTGPGVDVTPQLVNVARPMLVGRDPLDISATEAVAVRDVDTCLRSGASG
jgi:hypothetical protein